MGKNRTLFIIIIIIIIPVMMTLKDKASAGSKKSSLRCVLFNFGDSNSETGAFCAAFGGCLNALYGQSLSSPVIVPRFSDGRVYLDFLCENLTMSYLSPYLESSGSDFHHGVNFAVGYSYIEEGYSAFPLAIQIRQFQHFLNQTRLLRKQGKGAMLTDEDFANAIHSIDIGQNDLAHAFLNGSSYQLTISTFIPKFLNNIENSIKELYHVGARKFLLYNAGPLGCFPSYVPLAKLYGGELDKAGCGVILNKVAETFNKGLDMLCHKLRTELEEVVLVSTDMYSIKYDLFVNPGKYGFENPLEACLEQQTLAVCPNPSLRVSFDGLHFTEAANAIVASKISSGDYSFPPVKLRDFCKL